MRILLKLITCIIITSVSLHANAQKPQVKGTTPVKKFTPPKLYTTLGAYKDSVSIQLAIAEAVIGAKLIVTDDKKAVYTVTSYQFLYRKRTVTETEDGKPMPATSMVSDRFKVSPLPSLWLDKIREQLKSGEELYFFDVLVKDAQGHALFAPTLKIIVQ